MLWLISKGLQAHLDRFSNIDGQYLLRLRLRDLQALGVPPAELPVLLTQLKLLQSVAK